MRGALKIVCTSLLTLLFLAGVMAVITTPTAVYAATTPTDTTKEPTTVPCYNDQGQQVGEVKVGEDCAAVQSAGNCSSGSGKTEKLDLQHCDLITKYINPLINFFAAAVGVVIVIAIIMGGIQYSSSAGDPSKVSAAKAHIRNAIIALIAFFLFYGLIDFLIPGGLT